MANSRHSAAIFSPSSKRPTKRTRSSITEHSFQGITPSLYREKVSPMCPVQSVTYVSGRSKQTNYLQRTWHQFSTWHQFNHGVPLDFLGQRVYCTSLRVAYNMPIFL